MTVRRRRSRWGSCALLLLVLLMWLLAGAVALLGLPQACKSRGREGADVVYK